MGFTTTDDGWSPSMSAMSIIYLLSLLYILYYLSLAVYNVYFHPLRTVPGPKLCAAFYFPFNYSMWTGDIVHVIKDIHDRYGPVVRLSPDRVDFIDARAWDDIYGSTRGRDQFVRDLESYRFVGTTRSMLIADGANHTRQRKPFSYAFSDAALQEQEPLLQSYIDTMIRYLRDTVTPHDGDTKTTDLTSWINWLTFDIIGDLSLGQSFGCLEQRNLHPWISIIFDSLRTATRAGILQLYPFPFLPLTQIGTTAASAQMGKHKQFTADAVDRRIAAAAAAAAAAGAAAEKGPMIRKDFMAHVLRHNDAENGLTQQEIYDNSSLLVIAGSETAATTVCGAVYYLLKNPECYEKVTMEVRGAFGKQEDITMVAVNAQLPYMVAVIQEAMRLYPPAPMAMGRRVSRKGGVMIAGTFVPEKTVVGITQYAAYRSTLNFTSPNSFTPSRWLASSSSSNDKKEVFNPFSVGHANCLGQSMAKVETRLILAKLLWNFDFERLENSEGGGGWVEEQKVFTLWEKSGLVVGIKVRES